MPLRQVLGHKVMGSISIFASMRHLLHSDSAKFGAYLSALAAGSYSLFIALLCLLTRT